MITYLVNVKNCISLNYYDFFFFEAEAENKVVIINIDDLENADKQMDELVLDLSERYFEKDDNYEIIFCVPRYIDSANDYTENCDFVMSYRIRKCLGSRIKDYSRVFLFSIIYGSSDRCVGFESYTNTISDNFFSDTCRGDFPDFSKDREIITPEKSAAFIDGIKERIQHSSNPWVRVIFSELWGKYGISKIANETPLSEWEVFNALHDKFAEVSFNKEQVIRTYIKTDNIVGRKKEEISETLKFIKYVVDLETTFSKSDYLNSSVSLPFYSAVLAEYSVRLKSFYLVNRNSRDFVFEYRDPEVEIDRCENQYKEYNYSVYSAIRNNDTGVFVETIQNLKSGIDKDEDNWKNTYKEICKHIDYADGVLEDYIERVSVAYSKCEKMTDTIEVDTEDISSKLNEMEVDYKKSNQEFLDICEESNVNYKSTIDAKNKLSRLNRKIRAIFRCLRYSRIFAFVLTALTAVLSYIIPYTIGEPHVFENVDGLNIWLFSNICFALLVLLGAVIVHIFFSRKKKALYKEVIRTCDDFLEAYLKIANMYSRKLKTIAKIEKLSIAMDFLKESKKEFKLYEEKLSYHKNCIARIKNSLNYFHSLIDSADGKIKISPGEAEIDLEKDEKRNPFYYPNTNTPA